MILLTSNALSGAGAAFVVLAVEQTSTFVTENKQNKFNIRLLV